MKQNIPILCINGSDSAGCAGIQSDIKTVKDLGCHCATAVTSVTVQTMHGIIDTLELPTEVVAGQVRAVYEDQHPAAVKVGMVNNPSTIHALRQEIVGCRHIVCSPGILASGGGCLMSNESISTLCHDILPISTLLILKCVDAAIVLGQPINTDDEMLEAARLLHGMGAQWVMLRGGTHTAGRVNAILYGEDSGGESTQFFSSYDIAGWQQHGIGGTLSTAIATCLAMGDDVPAAIRHAHDYIRSQVVHTVDNDRANIRPNELYNSLLSLIADNYTSAHDVAFYADRLAITPRYLSQVTRTVVDKSPKQIIDEYIMHEAELILANTSLTIQEIALRLGFSSQITFAKFFRAKAGCAPSQRRKA